MAEMAITEGGRNLWLVLPVCGR